MNTHIKKTDTNKTLRGGRLFKRGKHILTSAALIGVSVFVSETAKAQTFCVDAAGNPVGNVAGPAGTACGPSATANTERSIAIGVNATAGVAGDPVNTSDDAIAIGTRANASGRKSIKIGASNAGQAGASGDYSSVIGYDANASGQGGVALGWRANSAGSSGLAIGTASRASQNGSSGIGWATQATGVRSTAIGSQSLATRAGSTAAGDNSRAIGERSTAVGQAARAANRWSVALGFDTTAGGVYSTAIGQRAYASATNAMAFGFYSRATGQSAIAIGERARATSSTDLAFGRFANASGGGALSFGAFSQATGLNSSAFGRNAVVSGIRSGAFGYNNQITGSYTYALGTEITADTSESVLLGRYASPMGSHNIATVEEATVGPLTYGGFAGDVDWGAGAVGHYVSVGAVGRERKLTNVAAGVIEATSTEAINGSQLHAVVENVGNLAQTTAANFGGGVAVNPDGSLTEPTYNITTDAPNGTITTYNNVGDALNALNDQVSQPITFAGDTGPVSETYLGEAVSVTGGATGPLAPGNIGVVSDGNGNLSVQLAENIDLGENGSVTMGDTSVDATGISVDGGNVTLTANGLNNGGNVITNVGQGVNGTDAVNVDQLTAGVAAATSEVAAGTNIASVETSTGANDQTIFTVNAEGASVSAGSSYVSVTNSDAGNNVTDYAVDVSQDIKDATDSVLNDGITFSTPNGSTEPKQLGDTLEIVGDTNNNIQVSVTPEGAIRITITDQPTFGNVAINPNGDGTITGVSDGVVAAGSTDVVNGSQLHQVAEDAKWSLAINGDEGVQVNPENNTVSLNQGQNIRITRATDGSNNVTVSTAPDIVVDSVTVSNGGPVLSYSGIDMRNQKITNLAPGAVSATSTDAINGSQLHGAYQAMGDLQDQISTNKTEANGGIASAMALGQIRYDDRPGKFSMGLGLGYYGGEQAFALGAGYTSESRLWRFSGGATYTPGSENVGAAVSATYTFN